MFVCCLCSPLPMSLSIPRGNIKPLSTVHQHFEDLPENRVKCKLCPWTHRKNATRQTEHMKSHKQPVESVEAQSEDDLLDLTPPVSMSQSTSSGCLKKRKQSAITEHVDRLFTTYERGNCELKQVFCATMNGQNYDSMAQPGFWRSPGRLEKTTHLPRRGPFPLS